MLKSQYQNFDTVIKDVVKLCESRKIQNIVPAYAEPCMESRPCRGHGGATITFDNGETVKYECSTVKMGIIMYYFGIENAHFTRYVDQELKEKIDNIRNKNQQ